MSEEAADLAQYEQQFRLDGIRRIAGVDEAGRGALAGPVVAGAVILPTGEDDLLERLDGVRDSKLCTPLQRDKLYEVVRGTALEIGVGLSSAQEVDEMGILLASKLAMVRAVQSLETTPEALLIDGGYMRLPALQIRQKTLVKGELKSISIAAASIIAKVERDRLMIDLAETYQGYGFARHKGYSTPQHRAALAESGPCPIHRRSFAPVRRRLFGDEGTNDDHRTRP